MLLYYITDRRQFAGDEGRQRAALLERIGEAARCGVDFVQLRERDLPVRKLEQLAREAVQVVRRANTARKDGFVTRLLVNSRVDVALAAGADGVHLRGDDISAKDARAVWRQTTGKQGIIAVSCHSAAESRRAAEQGADFAVFAPVFEKVAAPRRTGAGLGALAEACRAAQPTAEAEKAISRMPVFALGGVTQDNAGECLRAGAAGIAAIRLFQNEDLEPLVLRLRRCTPALR